MDSILLGLSLYKAILNYRTGAGGGLMRVLTRDSVLYFVLYVRHRNYTRSKILMYP